MPVMHRLAAEAKDMTDDARYVGIIKHWVDDGGYGFVEHARNNDAFVHVSDCHSLIPSNGDRISYAVTSGRGGKLRAVQVRPERP
jgi:cold shock CspA family protein